MTSLLWILMESSQREWPYSKQTPPLCIPITSLLVGSQLAVELWLLWQSSFWKAIYARAVSPQSDNSMITNIVFAQYAFLRSEMCMFLNEFMCADNVLLRPFVETLYMTLGAIPVGSKKIQPKMIHQMFQKLSRHNTFPLPLMKTCAGLYNEYFIT